MEKSEIDFDGEPGTIVHFIKGRGPLVKTGSGCIVLSEAKPENKRKLQGNDLINGNYFKLQDKLK